MEKIKTLFERDWDGDRSRVVNEVTPGCEWVLAGEGVATRKYDGTACLISGGRLFKRHEVKPGKEAPPEFVPAGHDEETGKTVGWVPVGDGPEDRWHRDAFENDVLADGTYELLGPKVQGNPEGYDRHILIGHNAAAVLADAPRTFDEFESYFAAVDIEGIVWHHPDGRMVKLKARDFGVRRPSTLALLL